MTFDPILAEQRFGYGLSPNPQLAPAHSAADLLARLNGSDDIASQFPIEPLDQFFQRLQTAQSIQKQARQAKGTAKEAEARKRQKQIQVAARQAERFWLWQTVMRRTWTKDAFRERLVAFWADHFTARGKAGIAKRAAAPNIEAQIRPHISGRFEDLLIAAVTSPLMVQYLDQAQSAGPNSLRGQQSQGRRGLNENLAREVLELHTLGVGSAYQQNDVRQLAELLTGLSYSAKDGLLFRPQLAEPGAETVLGKSYGGGKSGLRDIHAVLRDLARHPATADHIARKLVRHFIADTPPEDLVTALRQTFLDSGGDLMALYQQLLDHPAAFDPALKNVRLPDEYISAALRALAVSPAIYHQNKRQKREQFIVQLFLRPLEIMGQPWLAPLGPDGWDEGDEAWLTPQGLSARMQWALQAPSRLVDPLPDPRAFVTTVLGPYPPAAVAFAAKAAESRAEGIALILAAPAFQRK